MQAKKPSTSRKTGGSSGSSASGRGASGRGASGRGAKGGKAKGKKWKSILWLSAEIYISVLNIKVRCFRSSILNVPGLLWTPPIQMSDSFFLSVTKVRWMASQGPKTWRYKFQFIFAVWEWNAEEHSRVVDKSKLAEKLELNAKHVQSALNFIATGRGKKFNKIHIWSSSILLRHFFFYLLSELEVWFTDVVFGKHALMTRCLWPQTSVQLPWRKDEINPSSAPMCMIDNIMFFTMITYSRLLVPEMRNSCSIVRCDAG